MTETEYWKRFEDAKPRLLGAIFDSLCKALQLLPSVEVINLPRMADFTKWGVAVAGALGFSKTQFLSAYRQCIARQHEEALDASPVAQAVISLMTDQDDWRGTPTKLLDALNSEASKLSIDVRCNGWPKSPSWLWRRLCEARTNLEAIGFFTERSEGVSRHITIRKVPANAADAEVLWTGPSAPQHLQHFPVTQGTGQTEEELEAFRERVAIGELDGDLDREAAERQAAESLRRPNDPEAAT